MPCIVHQFCAIAKEFHPAFDTYLDVDQTSLLRAPQTRGPTSPRTTCASFFQHVPELLPEKKHQFAGTFQWRCSVIDSYLGRDISTNRKV